MDGIRGVELTPGPQATSDSDIEAFIRAKCGTSYHSAGTCRMGADDAADVDTDARVKAVSGMRIVDGSIMPHVVTGNLNAPIMMMAEKTADRIKGRSLAPADAGYYRSPA